MVFWRLVQYVYTIIYFCRYQLTILGGGGGMVDVKGEDIRMEVTVATKKISLSSYGSAP